MACRCSVALERHSISLVIKLVVREELSAKGCRYVLKRSLPEANRNMASADRDVERATQPSANVVPSTSRRPGSVSGTSDDLGRSWMAKQRWREAVKRIVDEQRAQRDLAPSRPGPSRRITWQRIPAASAHGPPTP